MGKTAAVKLHNTESSNDEHDEDEAPKSAEEVASGLREAVTAADLEKMVADLDKVEERISKAQSDRNEIYNRLVKKGCHKDGLKNFYKRRGRNPAARSKIDATFKVCCELIGGQEDLFA